jgi:hypothetical protein
MHQDLVNSEGEGEITFNRNNKRTNPVVTTKLLFFRTQYTRHYKLVLVY